MTAAESDVLSEIEVLQSIYLDELLVGSREDGGWEVSLVLHPSTAEDSVSQFVRLTLTLTLDQQYPWSAPAISIQNPRGLSDDKLSSVTKCLQLEAQACLGSPVLYQLIEKAKEILTESNIPHGNCVICLYDFKEGEAFTKTSCYHYFHSHCLGRYARHSERELQERERELEEDKTRDHSLHQELTVVCPVCREPLTYDVDQLLSSPAPQLPELDESAVSSDFQQKWRELQKLLEKQRSNGGIIDPEVESNRFLIHINETPENGTLEVDGPPAAPVSSTLPPEETRVRADLFGPGPPPGRGVQGHRRQYQARGPRRGGGRGRGRPHPGRAPPVAEQLDKLSLSSDCPEGTAGARAQGPHIPEGQREACAPPEGPPACQTRPEIESLKDAAEPAGGHRGRRRGPHQPPRHYGPPRYHWDGRAPRSRGGGGANHLCGGGGARRGHGRAPQQRPADREEVL
ncbi:E3 ubiquitin-protein ligase RNF25 [Salarias fasciatus]|uniref:E3 ubiquitin-protein ligase RNF25 n=1 Tax=Salarias fasciatus TaxID=181472 RepID=UPI001176F4A1|nr:E3 ubiquitin-protein ligase RNF25 [Salarias fasciatus]